MKSLKTVSFTIRSLSNLIRRHIDDFSTDHRKEGITGMQGAIIGFVFNNSHDRDIYQRDVESEFKIRRSTATGILKLMEKNGLIERMPVSGDGRLKKIVLTKKALEVHMEIVTHIRSIESTITKGLTQEEIDTFFTITDKMRANLEQK